MKEKIGVVWDGGSEFGFGDDAAAQCFIDNICNAIDPDGIYSVVRVLV
jgi:hypothetical protein